MDIEWIVEVLIQKFLEVMIVVKHGKIFQNLMDYHHFLGE